MRKGVAGDNGRALNLKFSVWKDDTSSPHAVSQSNDLDCNRRCAVVDVVKNQMVGALHAIDPRRGVRIPLRKRKNWHSRRCRRSPTSKSICKRVTSTEDNPCTVHPFRVRGASSNNMDYSRGRALSSAWVEVRNYRVNTAWGTNVRVGGGSRSLSRDGVRMGGLPAAVRDVSTLVRLVPPGESKPNPIIVKVVKVECLGILWTTRHPRK